MNTIGAVASIFPTIQVETQLYFYKEAPATMLLIKVQSTAGSFWTTEFITAAHHLSENAKMSSGGRRHDVFFILTLRFLLQFVQTTALLYVINDRFGRLGVFFADSVRASGMELLCMVSLSIC